MERLATVSFGATANGRQLVGDLRAVRDVWDNTIKARRDSAAWQVADLLLRQPVLDAAAVSSELALSNATQRNAQRAIAPLTDAGVLTEFTGSDGIGCGRRQLCLLRSRPSPTAPSGGDKTHNVKSALEALPRIAALCANPKLAHHAAFSGPDLLSSVMYSAHLRQLGPVLLERGGSMIMTGRDMH